MNSPAPWGGAVDLSDWSDPVWRLCSGLYWIVTEDGREIQFKPNEEQVKLLQNLWHLNLILKARQLGFTSLIVLMGLDHVIWNDNQSAVIIAHKLDDAKKIFRNKVQFAFKKLPPGLRQGRALETDTAAELVFNNGSIIAVSTSARSGTAQFMHISEYGYICAKHPDKAEEIKTGALNAVAAGQMVFIESTARGRAGDFFDKTQKAKRRLDEDLPLTQMDYRFHFFPWFEKDSYRLHDKIVMPKEYLDYFRALETEHGIKLDAAQMAWYVKKAEDMGDKMKREFPSTPDEAFEVAIEGAIYAKEMAWLRKHGRIKEVPHVPGHVVNTYWDLGRQNTTDIWFHQFVAGEHRFMNFYEASLAGLSHYVKIMQDLSQAHGYVYGRHFLPHDADNKNLEHNISRVERLIELGVPAEKIVVVPRIDDIEQGIEQTRKVLPACWFDKANCNEGLAGLDSYQYVWNEKQAVWMDYPNKNWASNPADAFRQFAQGWTPEPRKSNRRPKSPNWRTA